MIFGGVDSGWLREWILSDFSSDFGSFLASKIDEKRDRFRVCFLNGSKTGLSGLMGGTGDPDPPQDTISVLLDSRTGLQYPKGTGTEERRNCC